LSVTYFAGFDGMAIAETSANRKANMDAGESSTSREWHEVCSGEHTVADFLTLNALLEQTVADLDRKSDDLSHENTDVTDVMNWIAGVRQRARRAQNVDTLKLSAV
jgi:hypothetical protein